MKKTLVFVFTLFVLIMLSCTEDKVKEDIDFVWNDGTLLAEENNLPSTPSWLKLKIDTMSRKASYAGTKVDLYYWVGKFYYLVSVPLSKSVDREMYTVGGQKVSIMPKKLDGFYKNRIFKESIWTDNRLKYVPTDVIVKTKALFSTSRIFNLINSLQLNVEYMDDCVYISSLPPDSLSYVLGYLNAKSYTHSDDWLVTGSLHNQTNEIMIFPRLFNISNKTFQADWINSMNVLKLSKTEKNSYLIYCHVPNGEEIEWVKRFESSDSILWAELSLYINVVLH